MSGPGWTWVYGPCGAGKTATGYEIYRRLAASGLNCAYVEIDQLAMSLPLRDEQERVRNKIENLLSVLDNYMRAGVDHVVVSGDLAGPPMSEVLQRSAVQPITCRLLVDPEIAGDRLRSRGAPEEYAAWTREYDRLFPHTSGFAVDTSGRTVEEVAEAVLSNLGDLQSSSPGVHRQTTNAVNEPDSGPEGHAWLIAGPQPVGKSTVGWLVFMHLTSASKAAYVDLGQLSCTTSVHRPRLLVSNVLQLWRQFRAGGTSHMVLSGDLPASQVAELRDELAPTSFRAVVLTASTAHLQERASLRQRGMALELPGDTLRFADDAHLQRVVQDATVRIRELRDKPAGYTFINTDGMAPEAAALAVLADEP